MDVARASAAWDKNAAPGAAGAGVAAAAGGVAGAIGDAAKAAGGRGRGGGSLFRAACGAVVGEAVDRAEAPDASPAVAALALMLFQWSAHAASAPSRTDEEVVDEATIAASRGQEACVAVVAGRQSSR